ncbi:unnamed protein product [Lupinus luteus]|uniref:Uncharacterized protein n=1 Tax=Lupinus luteus TaxID=3873 RepID=A0AAV1YBN0_LUPLU
MSDSYNIQPVRMYFQYEPLHRHQSDHSANVFLNDMNFNFNQGDGAGPSSFPIEESIFPTEQTNTTEDQTRVQRRDVPRRTRRPHRCGTGSHFGDV